MHNFCTLQFLHFAHSFAQWVNNSFEGHGRFFIMGSWSHYLELQLLFRLRLSGQFGVNLTALKIAIRFKLFWHWESSPSHSFSLSVASPFHIRNFNLPLWIINRFRLVRKKVGTCMSHSSAETLHWRRKKRRIVSFLLEDVSDCFIAWRHTGLAWQSVWPTGILRCRFFQKQQLRKIKSIQVSAQDAFFHLLRGFQKHSILTTYLIKEQLDVKKRHLSILKSWSPCWQYTCGNFCWPRIAKLWLITHKVVFLFFQRFHLWQ